MGIKPRDEKLHALGILLAKENKFSEARTKIESAIALNPHHAPYYNNLGNILQKLNCHNEAILAYQQAIQLQPDYPIAYNNLGNCYAKLSKFDEAEKAYRHAILLKSDYADALCNLGILYVQLKEDIQAIKYLKKALSSNPNFLNAINQLADCYLRNEHYGDAENLFLKSLEYDSQNIHAIYCLGVAYYKQQAFEKAKNEFEKVLLLDYKYQDVNQYLANTLLEMSDHEKAMHYFFRQLELNPLFETLYNLGVLFSMKERHEDALHYFHEALKIHPNDFSTYLNCGNIFLKTNNLEKAIFNYQNAAKIRPDDPETHHILLALTQEKTPDNAPKAYVSHLFDQYAPYYEKHLIECLRYEVPKKIFEMIQRECTFLENHQWEIVDAGCGTGLCGELFKPFSKKLIGIDLSEKMIAIATEKKIYDELIVDDITTALNQFSHQNLIIAADVFTYIGDLNAIFLAAKKALASNGFFIFTAEKTHQKNFLLQSSIRFAHNQSYLESLIEHYEFECICFENVILRKQKNESVEGYLVLTKRI